MREVGGWRGSSGIPPGYEGAAAEDHRIQIRRDPRLRPRPRQPDRRAHGLQRRPRAPLRDRPRRDRRGEPRATTARSAPTPATRRARRVPAADPGAADGWRAFVRGTVAELRAAAWPCRAPTRLHRRRARRLGALLLGRAGGGAQPGAARARGRRGARPRRARAAVLAGGERLGRRGDRAARPARLAVLRGGRARCGSTSRRWSSSSSRSTCAAGSSRRWTRARSTSTPRAATTRGARECREICARLGIEHVSRATRTLRTRCPIRSRAAPGTCSPRTRASTRWSRRCGPGTCAARGGCWTRRTRACATTTRRACRRSRPRCGRARTRGPRARGWSAAASAARCWRCSRRAPRSPAGAGRASSPGPPAALR